MAPRRSKDGRIPRSPEALRVTHPHAAGMDVHAAAHYVAVPPDHASASGTAGDTALPPHVRRFGACTADLEALADWLRACGVATVARESTGVYWIPLFELLERRGFQEYLVRSSVLNARHPAGQFLERVQPFVGYVRGDNPEERQGRFRDASSPSGRSSAHADSHQRSDGATDGCCVTRGSM